MNATISLQEYIHHHQNMLFCTCSVCGTTFDIKNGTYSALSHGFCKPCLIEWALNFNKDKPVSEHMDIAIVKGIR